MPRAQPDVVVVGAGIVGLTTALLLAENGSRVVLVTAEPVGGGSTGRSAGVISQLHGTAYRRMRGETATKNIVAYRQGYHSGATPAQRVPPRTGPVLLP